MVAIDPSLKKGVLPLCVLALLKKDRYGYELVTEISRRFDMTEGTIYPLLRRMKSESFVDTYLLESSHGPARKYYKLNSKGRKRLQQMKKEWIQFSKIIDDFIGEKK